MCIPVSPCSSHLAWCCESGWSMRDVGVRTVRPLVHQQTQKRDAEDETGLMHRARTFARIPSHSNLRTSDATSDAASFSALGQWVWGSTDILITVGSSEIPLHRPIANTRLSRHCCLVINEP